MLDITVSHENRNTDVDARRVFLLKAAIRHELVERDEQPIDTAFGELVEPFSEIVGFPVCDICGSQPCINPSFCQVCRLADRRLAQKRRRR
jgi:hypothetical protein